MPFLRIAAVLVTAVILASGASAATAATAATAPATQPVLSPDDIPKMSDAELIQTYATARFKVGRDYERRADGWRIDTMRPRYLAFSDIRDEIVRRGGNRMTAPLAEFVRQDRAADRWRSRRTSPASVVSTRRTPRMTRSSTRCG